MLSLRENTRTEIAFKSLDDQPGIAEDTRSEVAEATRNFLDSLSPDQMSLLILAGGSDSHEEAAALGITADSKFPLEDSRPVFSYAQWARQEDLF